MMYSLSAWKTFLVEWGRAILRHNESPLARRLRNRLHRSSCSLDTGVVITNPSRFLCKADCALYHGTYILNNNGTVEMGARSHFGAMCYVNALYGTLTIGDDVAIGPHTDIILYSNHYEKGKLVTDCRIQKDIHVGNNVFIGAHSIILPGARIEDNVVIGAGSVVKGTLSSNGIYAGTPARSIHQGWHS